jgi:phosphoenolpyruvate-protein kinase (PTS system EI component)
MDGRPVTLRTLDIGADKQLPYFKTPDERNPALGWRGIRISLQWPDLLQVQLRAALRASAHGPVRLLLPMVGSLEQIDQAHAIYDEVRASLSDQGYELANDLPVGVMIEVPSLLFSLHQVIEHVDFVSVGTNDLVQYLLGVDRDNSFVAPLYQPHHPAVIAALERVALVASEAGKSCSVCGDIAADPAMAVLLIGLGFDSLSSAPQFTAEIKHALRGVTLAEAQEVARAALAETRADGVREVLREVRDRVYEGPVRAGGERRPGAPGEH